MAWRTINAHVHTHPPARPTATSEPRRDAVAGVRRGARWSSGGSVSMAGEVSHPETASGRRGPPFLIVLVALLAAVIFGSLFRTQTHEPALRTLLLVGEAVAGAAAVACAFRRRSR